MNINHMNNFHMKISRITVYIYHMASLEVHMENSVGNNVLSLVPKFNMYVYSITYQLSIISMHNQLSMEQIW